ncbi:hypothetical protein FB45DRAFT_386080 [Roridomyces roridus]|uniref:Secreted protein n=1 Tax=Roridomyces roridus TaxID=1738132 RepID=A0AAD7B212_9AGAR|nr:hypothetical protein FB45DRAFT_386080 [Roridomyces roridus]
MLMLTLRLALTLVLIELGASRPYLAVLDEDEDDNTHTNIILICVSSIRYTPLRSTLPSYATPLSPLPLPPPSPPRRRCAQPRDRLGGASLRPSPDTTYDETKSSLTRWGGLVDQRASSRRIRWMSLPEKDGTGLSGCGARVTSSRMGAEGIRGLVSDRHSCCPRRVFVCLPLPSLPTLRPLFLAFSTLRATTRSTRRSPLLPGLSPPRGALSWQR